MSSVGWKLRLETRVAENGTVKADGRTYWCQDLQQFAGWDVAVFVPKDREQPVQVWRGAFYLCSPDPIADTGFDDIGSVRNIVRRLENERAKLEEAAQPRISPQRVMEGLRLVGGDRSVDALPRAHPEPHREHPHSSAPTADEVAAALEETLRVAGRLVGRHRAKRASNDKPVQVPRAPAPAHSYRRSAPSHFLLGVIAGSFAIAVIRVAHRLSGDGK